MGQIHRKKGVAAFNGAIVRALEEIRKHEGFKSELAFIQALKERTGAEVTESTYNRWKTGQIQAVPGWVLVAAAEAWGYSLDDLLTLSNSRLVTLEEEVSLLQEDMIQVMEKQVQILARLGEADGYAAAAMSRDGRPST